MAQRACVLVSRCGLVHQGAQSDHQDVLAHVSAELRLRCCFVAKLARLVALNLVKEAWRLPNLHFHRLLNRMPGHIQYATAQLTRVRHRLSMRLDRAQRKVDTPRVCRERRARAC